MSSIVVDQRSLHLNKTVEVEVETLDGLSSKLGLNEINFIKIDVEGAELDVLKGCERALQNNRTRLYLAIAAYHYPHEFLDVARYLRMKGFKVFSDRSYVYAFK